jgi:hypothetical protein
MGCRNIVALPANSGLLPPGTEPGFRSSAAFAIHELSANAVKHGALGSPSGRVCVAWSISPEAGTGVRRLQLLWSETVGEAPPRRTFV